MQVEFDPKKGAANLKKYGVSLDATRREERQYAQGI
jgi:uncharacterized DUF497 family protein